MQIKSYNTINISMQASQHDSTPSVSSSVAVSISVEGDSEWSSFQFCWLL